MAITRERTFESLHINAVAQVRLKWLLQWFDNGVEEARKNKELFLDVGDDVSNLPNIVQTICNAAWTPGVRAARLAVLNEILANAGLQPEADLEAAKAAVQALNAG